MQSLKRWLRVNIIKWGSWEYWPMWLVYLPLGFYYVYLSIKAKSLFFFSAANPSIEVGGMFFESKWKIFELIPKQYFPETIIIREEDSEEILLSKLNKNTIQFPLIAKPDRGERGTNVEVMSTEEELIAYKKQYKVDFLIQAYCKYPLEFSIFYYKNPDKENGIITSITFKELLSVIGDGVSTINKLIEKSDRAFLQLPVLQKKLDTQINKILPIGTKQVLVPTGNHCKGATFLDYGNIIDDQLTQTFNTISNQIKGFYFGRYDLLCTSIEDLKQGKNIAIVELNGAGAEPGHIYEPGYPFLKGQQAIFSHFNMMFTASTTNHKKGVKYLSLREYFAWKKAEKIYKQKQKSTKNS